MRHRHKVKKLGRTASHRRATLRNIASALIEHHQIRTTLAKAKAAQRYVDHLITYGKQNTVHARRLAFRLLQDHQLVKILFDDIAPAYNERNGGYTRVIKLGMRPGDGAQLAILQLVGFEELIIDDQSGKKTKRKGKPKAEKKKAAPTAKTDQKEEVVKEKQEPAGEETTEEVVEETPAEKEVEENEKAGEPEKEKAKRSKSKQKTEVDAGEKKSKAQEKEEKDTGEKEAEQKSKDATEKRERDSKKEKKTEAKDEKDKDQNK